MKALRAWCNRMYASEAGRLAFSIFAALALYAIAWVLQPVITFYDNDDLNIAWALAGYRGQTPAFAHPFINPMTAAAVSGLYTLLPGVPWWYAVQTFCMLVGIAASAMAALKIAHRNGLPLAVPLILVVLLCGGTYYYAVAQVMFTLSSTVLGMAAAALVLAADACDPPARARRYWGISVLMLALSLLVRQSSGLCALCFYYGCIAYRIFTATAQRRIERRAACGAVPPKMPADHAAKILRQGIVTATCAALCAAVLMGVNAWGRANQHEDGFLAFENARAEYMDYAHDLHYENRALYASIDWDEPLQGLVDAWFYMDERVNAKTLSTAAGQSRVNAVSAHERAVRAWEDAGAFLGKYPIARYLGGIACCVLLILLAVGLVEKRGLPVLFGCGVALGALLLAGYLFWRGRMNLRTWMTILFPAILTLALIGMDAYAPGKPGRRAVCCILSCALALPALFCGYKIFRTVVSYDSRAALDDANAVVDYAMAHPGNVYIRDVYVGNNYDALRAFPAQKPTNLVDWGGCDMYTRARRMQWAVNGYDVDPYAEVFFDENVYYVCDPNERYLPMLDAYMRASHGASGYEIVDTLGNGFAIVRFLP